ncbi:MAG: ABC transporter ATP-binding protein, partial [Chloroflexi bacterium]|nr:ABC transporter ATP-binding protein [Chloroflexota bacterium]
MLSVEGLSAWYGEAQVLRELDFRLEQGQVVTLVGR